MQLANEVKCILEMSVEENVGLMNSPKSLTLFVKQTLMQYSIKMYPFEMQPYKLHYNRYQ